MNNTVAPTQASAATQRLYTEQDVLQVCAYLLSYPSETWWSALNELEAELSAWSEGPIKESLGSVVEYITSQTQREYEDEYVRVFDFSGNTNMYLTSYDATNAEEQAAELLVYKEFYQKHGFDVARELPDYVPALLELCSTLSVPEALPILAHSKESLVVLRQRLIDSRQVQAFILDVILQVIERWEGTTR
ncbi:nitrate reductase molybdenum cofactor assembly chaperone [Veillonella criceti]|uniref:Nitrate reductase-like protein narX n=1 Tax=Veillonella criceti TaxID=103891 RepID=A0A380NLF5_9FIRM|nr:nitrate reductase molybdenum cofactor assembly chaperone [Veillonella criceti]SUP43743.1 Nitrate reductase-like protein narX [Veillonella criceti]